MLIRVKAIGGTGPSDPVRVDLPTYGMIGLDPVTMLATVDVPDPDFPPNAPPAGDPTRPNTPYGPVLTGVPQTQLPAWHAALRGRYPGKGAQWTPPAPQ